MEIAGRWSGLGERKLQRPALTLRRAGAGGEVRALAESAKGPWSARDGEPWLASFPCDLLPDEAEQIELSVAPNVTIALRRPGRPTARAGDVLAAGRTTRGAATKRKRGPQRRAADVALSAAAQQLTAELGAAKRALELERERRAGLEHALEDERAVTVQQRAQLAEVQSQLAEVRAQLEAARERVPAAQSAEAQTPARDEETQSADVEYTGTDAQDAHADARDTDRGAGSPVVDRSAPTVEPGAGHALATPEAGATAEFDPFPADVAEVQPPATAEQTALLAQANEPGREPGSNGGAGSSGATGSNGGAGSDGVTGSDGETDLGDELRDDWLDTGDDDLGAASATGQAAGVSKRGRRKRPPARGPRPVNPSLRHRTWWIGRLLALLILAVVLAAIWLVVRTTILHHPFTLP